MFLQIKEQFMKKRVPKQLPDMVMKCLIATNIFILTKTA